MGKQGCIIRREVVDDEINGMAGPGIVKKPG
jgi:hypothetical protein